MDTATTKVPSLKRKALVACAGAALLGLAVGSGPAAADRRSGGRDGDAVQRGRALYARHCASCHGAEGRGNGSEGRDLDPPPTDLTAAAVTGRSDRELFKKITRGRRPMPSFRKLMGEEERWQVIHFIRTLPQRKSAENSR